ncbi:MAG: MBL fold metallo-hydrolase, partial [Betaproteobacteria bacterium]
MTPCALFAAALFATAVSAQEDFSKVEIQTEKLADTVYMMTGSGGNLGLSVGEDAVFVIDDQFAPLTPKIQAAIAKLSSEPVKFVLNTHWHFDHTGGNENLGKAGAIIVAHENVRKRLSTEGFIEFFGMKTKPEPQIALPVVTFTRDISFHLNGDELVVTHAPRAHTDGDSMVRFGKSNVVHMGDTFFNKLYPFIDT